MKVQEYAKQKGTYYFFCPACKEFHTVHTINTVTGHRNGLKFELQGTKDNPTFVPIGQPIERTIEKFNKSLHASRTDYVCVSIIRSGTIRFLPQSTHWLSGQIVPLPDLTSAQL
jgi:hypothetical protein